VHQVCFQEASRSNHRVHVQQKQQWGTKNTKVSRNSEYDEWEFESGFPRIHTGELA